MSLERRTPLKRTGGLKRSGALKARKRLAPSSPQRRAQAEAMADVRSRVFARDHRQCVLAGQSVRSDIRLPWCRGPLTVHHLLKAGQGGPYSECNLVTLCAGHNGWVEDEPLLAHHLGLVVRRGDDLLGCWGRLVELGLVDYWWTGASPPAL